MKNCAGNARKASWLGVRSRVGGYLLALFILLLFAAPFCSGQTNATPSMSVWANTINQTPTPSAGCFEASFPSLDWQQAVCQPEPIVPATVGGAVDWYALSYSNIGYSDGQFTNVAVSSEHDSNSHSPYCNSPSACTNWYTLQINSEYGSGVFQCNTSYTGGKTSECWEQFLFFSEGATRNLGYVTIQYWLINYYSNNGNCPSGSIPNGGSSWVPAPNSASGPSCVAQAGTYTTPSEPISNLNNLNLAGSADFSGSTNDQVSLVDVSTGLAYSVSEPDGVLTLANYWTSSEFNILGFGAGSTAIFSASTSLTVNDFLETQNAQIITPNCVYGGFSGETNNLNIYLSGSKTCTVTSNNYMVFVED